MCPVIPIIGGAILGGVVSTGAGMATEAVIDKVAGGDEQEQAAQEQGGGPMDAIGDMMGGGIMGMVMGAMLSMLLGKMGGGMGGGGDGLFSGLDMEFDRKKGRNSPLGSGFDNDNSGSRRPSMGKR